MRRHLFSFSIFNFIILASSSFDFLNTPDKDEILVNSLLSKLLYEERSEVVLIRDFITAKSTSLLAESVANVSLQWNDAVFFQWNKQKLPTLPSRHIEYRFSWLDRPWRVRQSNKIVLIVVVMKDNFQKAIEHTSSFVSFDPYHIKAIFWFPDATQNETDTILLGHHASFFKYKVGLTVTIEDTIVLRSVCFFCDKGEPKLVTAAIYHFPKHFAWHNVFKDYTKNMHGKHIRGTYVYPIKPKVVRQMQKDMKAVNFIEAYITDLYEYMNADMYVEVYDVPPNATAVDVELEDGSWYGQLGEVLHDRAVFGTGTNINGPALKIAEFPHVFTFPIWRYVTRKPRPRYGWYAIGQPFAPDMWIAIFIACCFGIVIFRFFLWLQSHFLNPFYPHPPPNMVWGYCLSYIFLPLMEENPPKVPTSHTARTFVAFWWVYATVITCCYDTKLIGFLASPELETIPQSFRSIVKDRKWNLAMQAPLVPYFSSFSYESEMKHHHQVRDLLQPSASIQECLQRTLKENAACIDVDAFLIPFSMFHVDKFGTYPFQVAEDENTFDIRASSFVQRHSVIAPSLRKIGLHLHSSGFLDRYHMEFPKMCKLTGMKLSRAANIHYTTKMELVVEQLKGPLMLMVIIGWLLPALVFIKEVAQCCCEKKRGNSDVNE